MSQPVRYSGLTDSEVAESRALNGVNLLTPAERTPLWKLFLEKFTSPLIVILLVVGVLSVGISFYEYYALDKGVSVFFEPIGIFVAILLATGLAFWFEVKADREFAILNQVNDDEPVQVIRNGGNRTEVPRRDIVVGDIVVLNTGEEIPADGDLLEAVSLNVDESTLTGRARVRQECRSCRFRRACHFPHQPRDARHQGDGGSRHHAGYRSGRRHRERKGVHGRARSTNSVKTPLNEQLERLGRLVSIASYVIAALVVVGRLIMYFIQSGDQWVWVDFISYFLQTIMIAVTLVVVSVPEGLRWR